MSEGTFYQNFISFHGGGSGDADEDQTANIIIKVVSIISILAMTIGFGFIPYFW